MYDVVVIGAGVIGSSVARYLSRYHARVCVVEKEEDVCCGTSKANSAIVHAGFDARENSLKARYNVAGSKMMPALARELDFPYRQNGSIVLCLREEDRPRLEALYENGIKNGVEGLRIMEREELRKKEPHVSEKAVCALWAPTGGIVCPFLMTIAMAENAYANGVEFRFCTQVLGIQKEEEGWRLETDGGSIRSACVVNAAGVYSDRFHNMVSSHKLHITPRRGDYFLLDKETCGFVESTIFQLPGQMGKGVLVSPTVHGNTIVGPTAFDIEDREGVNTTAEGLEMIREKASALVEGLPVRQVITSFAGLRAHEEGHEFLVGEASDAPGFFDCAGIESPGLSSAPAIGQAVAEMVREKLSLSEKLDFVPTRKGILDPDTLSREEYQALIRREPAYGQIICRCERVTEGEIIDAIRRPLGAKSLDGVKRRVRAGMGRCQSGFCSPRVMEILARELQVDIREITKSGGDSRIIAGVTKEVCQEGTSCQ
ncbi:MAG: NAD(P)/FAD-dependent oxidoreductase [Eubacteriales bacterium]|nr:NAD(P)/FAD-dependent oxidoreductase [Eubacteriales bacterium]